MVVASVAATPAGAAIVTRPAQPLGRMFSRLARVHRSDRAAAQPRCLLLRLPDARWYNRTMSTAVPHGGYSYNMPSAPPDSWRSYDPHDPDPGYYEFDWISARHPDLYHRFALSTVGLMDELETLVDLSGLEVVDIGAGTGRSTVPAAKKATHVCAIDPYRSVAEFGRNEVKNEGLTNVTYVQGECSSLPLRDRSVDVALSAHAVIDWQEAYRVLKPDGWLIVMACVPGSGFGDLTEVLAPVFPEFAPELPPREWFDPGFPPHDSELDGETWNGIPVDGMRIHDFTYVNDYGDPNEAAAILGRIYGPEAEDFTRDNGKSSFVQRLRIYYGQIHK
jgi:SAM-dependent methyltransferase